MTKFPPVYTSKESEILITIYENPDVSFDTYALTMHLNPGVTATSSEFEGKFRVVVKATEQLIVRGLIDGTQLKGGLGLYFSEMKLKYKGKQEAIQERDKTAEFNRKLPEIIEEADTVAEELKRAMEKK